MIPLDPRDLRSRRRMLKNLLASGVASGAGLMPIAFGARAADEPRGDRRSALVIGNASYQLAPLKNPVNDARLVAQTLTEIGFDVQVIENATLAVMLHGMREWISNSADARVRAFYFAGHGTQYKGDNYLVPVDLQIVEERQIRRKAISLSVFVESLSAQPEGVNFVIVDACRTDPLALLEEPRSRALGDVMLPGFVARPAPRGTVVAYSTSPGALAADSLGERNSVFTQALATYLKSPGLTVESMFKRVRASVMRATKNTQVPWESSSLVGDFCFRPNPSGQCGDS